ncbi:uncharacterized protein BDV17DRAFT_295920 [Aspergillus undulatus]|uniref:uncharacterized protein n=1 Tax=Aspergillus undulatus TaxID=1810928 RepID=UPI003CCD76A0
MATPSDTTPLLADSEPLEAGEYTIPQDGAGAITTPAPKPPYFRTTVVLTHLSAGLAILAFLFDLVVICIDAASPGGFYLFWNLRERLQVLFAISILALITTSLNLARLRHVRRSLWLWVNLIIDAVIVIYTVTLAPEALALNFDQSPTSWLPDRRAATTAQSVIVLLGVGLGAGLGVGLTHFVLFPLRCYAAFVEGSWDTWRVPGGEFKVEFSIKFLRQEERQERLLQGSSNAEH